MWPVTRYYNPTEANNQNEKHMNNLTPYDQEMLTALYASYDFMKCNDLPCEEVNQAILLIEAKNKWLSG